MARLWSSLIGYLFGNVLSAMVVGRILRSDPTKVGSGNPGSANVGAVYGKKWGILTCCGDLLKTALAILLVHFIFAGEINLVYTGLGLVIGHCFPILNKFKGGKGVACAGLLSLIYDLKTGLILLLLCILLIILMKNLAIPPLFYIITFSIIQIGQNQEAGLIFLLITLILVIRFWQDIIDFFAGRSKKVDILTTIKKKSGLKVR